MTVKDLAELAGVSTAYIRRLLGRGDIKPVIKHGEGKRGFWEIPHTTAYQWLQGRKETE